MDVTDKCSHRSYLTWRCCHSSRAIWLFRFALVASVLVSLVEPISAQVDPTSEVAEPSRHTPGRLEDTVVTDMLSIVDNKFDTLTTRITALERAVSNLQFFSIRQFRQMGGFLQEVSQSVETVGEQVGKLEVDGRGLKITSSLLHREVTEMKEVTNAISDELAASVVYINKNMDKQSQFIKAVVQDTFIKLSQNSKKELNKSLTAAFEQQKRQDEDRHPVNCSVDFSPVFQHIDRRSSHLNREIYRSVADLVKAEKSTTTAKCEEILKRYQEEIRRQPRRAEMSTVLDSFQGNLERNRSTLGSNINKRAKLDIIKKAKQSTTAEVTPRGGVDTVRDNLAIQTAQLEQSASASENDTKSTSDQDWQDENDAMVMEALTNMTTSVQQAVSYFRNTAHLLEMILSNTDMLLQAQIPPAGRPGALPLPNSGINGIRYQPGPLPVRPNSESLELSNNIPGGGRSRIPVQAPLPVKPQDGKECVLPGELTRSMATFVKNGSQLLEILTDLAQMSSMSLQKAVIKLHNEIRGVDGLHDRMEAVLLSVIETASKMGKESIDKLVNTTDSTHRLVESIVANTKWLPIIFHNVKHQSALGNRTLHFSTHNHGLLRRLVHFQRQEQQARAKEDKSVEKASHDEQEEDWRERYLATFYNTSLELHKIMPALSKFLAEPDPLFTIVDGGRPDQGRIEIYHLGRWGALCQGDLSHADANLICRHLGFKGGISAGAGYFGAGAGVVWSINSSCLTTAKCVRISDGTTPPCSHERDAGVICDHMLRIAPLESDSDSEDKTGRLEIHHRNLWLPICGDGWSDYSARVACQQMGHTDGRMMELDEWMPQNNTTWLSGVSCDGTEFRLDACPSYEWTKSCKGLKAAGVRCL
ncbi:neurotrypsin [Plakobranchus ocellatus]|uniref:Neurotrypsin n=1 Tax=Plakobranchus ocellatus TaxID=259542 RepID=A0AAV4D1S6_9GAST|nr:neurotrypsin [Plakobranchus ocellatus]